MAKLDDLSKSNKHSQYSYYKYIKEHIENKGEMPSYSQISSGMGMGASKSVVHRIVQQLREKGLLKVKIILIDKIE